MSERVELSEIELKEHFLTIVSVMTDNLFFRETMEVSQQSASILHLEQSSFVDCLTLTTILTSMALTRLRHLLCRIFRHRGPQSPTLSPPHLHLQSLNPPLPPADQPTHLPALLSG